MQIDVSTASKDELAAAYLSLEKQLQSKENTITILEQRISWFERQIFGAKSERLIPQDPKQTTLFEVPEEIPAETTTIKSYERENRRNPTDTETDSKLRFDANVPVEEEVILPAEVEGLEENQYTVVGEKVTERLVQEPLKFRVKRTIRKTVKIHESQTLHTAPAPAAVIERSFADVTVLAGLVTDKFLYHLPLYRQHQRLERCGIHISRGHLTRLTHRTLELLEPIYLAVLSSIVTNDVISMDETPIKAGRKGKGKMQTAYFWPVYAGEQVAFVYSSTRGHKVVSEILGTHCQKLLSDGYSAYERYAETREDLIHAQCWAHVRRKFFDGKEHAPPECEQILALIAKLFEIEAKIKDASEEEIYLARREQSLGVVYELFEYFDHLWFEKMVDKTSLLGKALQYAKNREKALKQFLYHPDIAISNNHVERAIRPVAVGRKNWMFCWSEVGAKYAAIAFTLVECCKMHGVDPWKYFVDVLQRIDTHPARDVHMLTPALWKEHFGG